MVQRTIQGSKMLLAFASTVVLVSEPRRNRILFMCLKMGSPLRPGVGSDYYWVTAPLLGVTRCTAISYTFQYIIDLDYVVLERKQSIARYNIIGYLIPNSN
jgi:hypothetical protein